MMGVFPGSSRSSRQWLNLAASVTLLIAILVVLQFIAERHNVRFDLTPSKRLSLSETTKRILAEVTDDLEMEVFHARDERAEVADLLRQFAGANPRIHYRLYDLDRYPEKARAAGVRHPQRARVSYRDVTIVVSTANEAYLAGGILRVVRGKPRQILFVTGHGERPLREPGSGRSYWTIVRALLAENATTSPIDLGVSASIPSSVAAVVVAGPRTDLLPAELAVLRAYLDGGGSLLLLVDPAPLPALGEFVARYGARLGEDILVDRHNRLLNAEDLAIIVPHYRMHPVTAPTDVPAILFGARTVDAVDPEVGAEATVVARSLETAWATPEIEAALEDTIAYQPTRDRMGPNSVMVAVSLAPGGVAARGGRLVVIGDSDFASDDYVDLKGNRDLVLNAISWLTDEDALIARRPRELAEIARPLSPLVLTEKQARSFFLMAVVAEPGLILLAGIAVVVRRRKR